MKIYNQTNGKMTEADRLQMATLPIKAGHKTWIEKEVIAGKPTMVVEAE